MVVQLGDLLRHLRMRLQCGCRSKLFLIYDLTITRALPFALGISLERKICGQIRG
jgi:hypothetical protein